MVAEAKQSTLALAGKVASEWLQRLSGYVVSLIRGPKEEEVGLSQDASDEKKELHRLLNRDVVMRRGIIVIVIALGGFLAWATLAPLTEGVVAMGTVVVDTEHKTIQHLEGGIIENLYVREGSEVKAGDVLVELSETQNRAQLELLESRYYGRLAEINRLNAERLLKEEISFSDDLVAPARRPGESPISCRCRRTCSRCGGASITGRSRSCATASPSLRSRCAAWRRAGGPCCANRP